MANNPAKRNIYLESLFIAGITARRHQFSGRSEFTMTVHKSQGQTFEIVLVFLHGVLAMLWSSGPEYTLEITASAVEFRLVNESSDGPLSLCHCSHPTRPSSSPSSFITPFSLSAHSPLLGYHPNSIEEASSPPVTPLGLLGSMGDAVPPVLRFHLIGPPNPKIILYQYDDNIRNLRLDVVCEARGECYNVNTPGNTYLGYEQRNSLLTNTRLVLFGSVRFYSVLYGFVRFCSVLFCSDLLCSVLFYLRVHIAEPLSHHIPLALNIEQYPTFSFVYRLIKAFCEERTLPLQSDERTRGGIELKLVSNTWVNERRRQDLADKKDKIIIDFIVVGDRLRSKVVDTRVYRGVNGGTVVVGIKALCLRWRHQAKMVTTELERIKVGKLQDQDIKDECIERLKDSLGEIKQYECLELDELWKVMKSVLVDEAKKGMWSE
ncbi:hypothetical protein EVAR_68805_1 [Eumeta japonica]|uniref:Uncharacterized protein n=1 Tax=Eumeta variegata TaxID=151549 RepID=A0A4C1Z1S3_EUMVA|nr:hypothetical protein EVAR_68805_1 [Eumeta japonica]